LEEAEKILNQSFPNIINENRNLRIILSAQKFIELIRTQSIQRAIKFAQENLNFSTEEKFISYHPSSQTGVETTIEVVV
jgi:hypothetical protein